MKSILLKTWEVQAILDGIKTQTRRVIKPRDPWKPASDGSPAYVSVLMENGEWGWSFDGCIYGIIGRSPYQPGDLLWVRETWGKDDNGEYVYRTNYGTTEDDSFPPSMFKWRPSIHMPEEAARLFLRVKDVRVERLQDISEDDARADGVRAYGPNNCSGTSARIAFAELWDSLNAKRGLGWDTNPWVWVIEFKVVQKP